MENKVILKRTIIICAIVILIDQILKIIVVQLCSNNSIEVIKNIFSIEYTKNIGVAFSINKDNLKNIIISACIIIFIIRYLFTQKKFLNPITLTCLDMVVAGGIGNLIDRIFRGGVVDFIKILNFPIFNFADIMVVIGWILFAIYILKIEVIKK